MSIPGGESREGSEPIDRVIPAGLLTGVFVTSLALIWVAVEASRSDLAPLRIYVPVGAAALQAGLIALVFLRLPWERVSHLTILLSASLVAGVLVALCLIDTRGGETSLDPTSPLVEEKLEQARQSLSDPDF